MKRKNPDPDTGRLGLLSGRKERRYLINRYGISGRATVENVVGSLEENFPVSLKPAYENTTLRSSSYWLGKTMFSSLRPGCVGQ